MRRVVLLVLFGLLLGALLTGVAGALPGSQDLNALNWLATVATVAALVVAVGIYRVQQSQSDIAHQELLDALKAQDEILQDLADVTAGDDSEEPEGPGESVEPAQPEPEPEREPAEVTEPPPPADRTKPDARPERGARPQWLSRLERLGPGDPDTALTAEQRDAVEAQFGEGAIEFAWPLGAERGSRARLVQLRDGTLLSVTNPDRDGRIRVRQISMRHDARGDRRRERRERGRKAS
jgi:hypothetical protein